MGIEQESIEFHLRIPRDKTFIPLRPAISPERH